MQQFDIGYGQYNSGYEKFLYRPFMPLPNLNDYMGQIIEVRIDKCYLTKYNKGYKKRNFYGSDIYTSDSDPVCIICHVGAYTVTDEEPTDFEGVAVFFRVSKGRNTYPSTSRNGIKSKKIASYDGHSIKFERVEILKKFGTKEEVKAMASLMPTHIEPIDYHQQRK